MSGGKAPPSMSARLTEDEHDDEEDEEEQEIAETTPEETTSTQIKSSERYFIVKSLTLQDLEQSVRNGIWATQSHNEDVLNRAYRVRIVIMSY
jgi:YT521-B-like domain